MGDQVIPIPNETGEHPIPNTSLTKHKVTNAYYPSITGPQAY